MRLRERLAASAAGLVRRAPRAAATPLAWIVGALLMAAHGRRATLENLERAFPEWSRIERWRVAFAAYRNTAHAAVEFLHAHKIGDEEMRDRVELVNPEAIAEAHGGGRGVILVSGHFGNWEWLGRRVSVEGYRFAALYKEPKGTALAERLRDQREAAGIPVIDHEDTRAALRWLRDGGVLGVIMDQEPKRPEDGAVAPLFGHPTRTHVGPFRLARMTGAPILSVFARRTGSGRYRARFTPFEPSGDPDPDRANAADAAAFNARLEAAIRRNPDHWLWMYPRWKRISRGSAVEA
ncbi:MAG: lysophospholipid acyltransferase family protein [Gemmatimonadota bacterium]|nr:lysophospholipid acyltransferase family protein [Gemmatimonadota bacterium]